MAGILVEIVGNASQFKRELDKAVSSTAKANGGFRKMGRAAGIAGVAIGGALVVGLAKAAEGALEDQVAQERLATAFKNAHVPIKGFTDRIEKATDAAVKMGFHDEEAAGALGTLVTATHNGKKAIDLLGTAMDIARFKHVDLDAASKMLTATMAGNVRSAKALGIVLLPVTKNVDALRARYKELEKAIPPAELATAKIADKQATAAMAIEKVNKALHGQADAFSKTGAGKLAVFNAQMDQLSDNLGKNLLPALNYVVDKLNVFAAYMKDHTQATKIFVIALAGLSAALIAVSIATAIATAAMSPFLVPIIAATASIALLSVAIYKLVTDFKKNWPLLIVIMNPILGAMVYAVNRWHTQILAAFTAAWNAVKNSTIAAMNAVQGFVRGAAGAAGAAARAVGQAILGGIMDRVNAIANRVRAAFNAVWAAIKALTGLARGAGLAIGEAVTHGIIAGLTSLAGKAAGVIKDAIGHLPHIDIPGFSPIEHVGWTIGNMVGSGVARGLKDNGPKVTGAATKVIKDASDAAAKWAQIGGAKAGQAFATGFSLPLSLQIELIKNELVGNVAGQIAVLQKEAIILARKLATLKPNSQAYLDVITQLQSVNSQIQSLVSQSQTPAQDTSLVGGGSSVSSSETSVNVVVNVAGSVTSENDLAETVRRSFLRTQGRNGNLGFT